MEKQYMYVQAPGMGKMLWKAMAFVFVLVVVAWVCAMLDNSSPMDWETMVTFSIGIVILGGIVALIICLFLRWRNHELLEKGEMVWATVDMDMTVFDEKALYVYCYMDYYGLKVYFRGCIYPSAQLAENIIYFLETHGKIPVVIGRRGIEHYRVLLEDVAYMLDEKKRFRTPNNVIQTIEWSFEKEDNATEASDF